MSLQEALSQADRQSGGTQATANASSAVQSTQQQNGYAVVQKPWHMHVSNLVVRPLVPTVHYKGVEMPLKNETGGKDGRRPINIKSQREITGIIESCCCCIQAMSMAESSPSSLMCIQTHTTTASTMLYVYTTYSSAPEPLKIVSSDF